MSIDEKLSVAVSWFASSEIPEMLRALSPKEVDDFVQKSRDRNTDLSLVFEGTKLKAVRYGELSSRLLPDELDEQFFVLSGLHVLEYHGCPMSLAPEKVQQDLLTTFRDYFELLKRHKPQDILQN